MRHPKFLPFHHFFFFNKLKKHLLHSTNLNITAMPDEADVAIATFEELMDLERDFEDVETEISMCKRTSDLVKPGSSSSIYPSIIPLHDEF